VKLPGLRPTWAPIVGTGNGDVVQTWKLRFGLEGKRSLHEQLGLPLAQERDSSLTHTKILFLMRYLLTFPDSTKGWIPFAMQALEQKKDMKVDVILTTSLPVSAHLIGRNISALSRRRSRRHLISLIRAPSMKVLRTYSGIRCACGVPSIARRVGCCIRAKNENSISILTSTWLRSLPTF
jgi:hypothetical protein